MRSTNLLKRFSRAYLLRIFPDEDADSVGWRRSVGKVHLDGRQFAILLDEIDGRLAQAPAGQVRPATGRGAHRGTWPTPAALAHHEPASSADRAGRATRLDARPYDIARASPSPGPTSCRGAALEARASLSHGPEEAEPRPPATRGAADRCTTATCTRDMQRGRLTPRSARGSPPGSFPTPVPRSWRDRRWLLNRPFRPTFLGHFRSGGGDWRDEAQEHQALEDHHG